MGFLNVLKKVLHIADDAVVPVAQIIDPPLGNILKVVLDKATSVEAALGDGTGTQKKQQVVAAVVPIATDLLNNALKDKNATNQTIDQTKLTAAIGTLVDAVVGTLNSVQVQTTTTAGTGATKP